jgi:predicted nucleotidyltransferase
MDMSNPVEDKIQILQVLEDHAAELNRLGVRKVGLFGSFVRGEQNARSDVDLLVQFEPQKKTFENFMNLSFLLEQLLQRRVELVTTESLSPYIGPHILREVEYAHIST